MIIKRNIVKAKNTIFILFFDLIFRICFLRLFRVQFRNILLLTSYFPFGACIISYLLSIRAHIYKCLFVHKDCLI
jgi:hypothetical protein